MPQEPGEAPESRRARFSELNVRVGARLQLVVSTLGRTTQLASTLIGYAEPEFLIVRTPSEGGLAVRLDNGVILDVRLFTGTRVAQFQTSLLRQFSAPLSYWHLSYPQDVRVTTLRAAPRTRVDLAAQASRDGAAAVPIRLIDLSAVGAKALAPERLGERGQTLQLAFDLPRGTGDAAAKITVAATIRAVKPVAADGEQPQSHAHGLQFENLSDGDRVLLQNFVLQMLNDAPASGV